MKSLGIDVGGTSVKAALFDTQTGEVLGRWNSGPYRRPDRAQLMEAVGEATSPAMAQQPGAIGLCCPGVVDTATGKITRSVNLPGLEGYPAASLVRGESARIMHVTDAFAAAIDVYCSEGLEGRLLAVSLGTGVGAAVIDPGPVQLLLHGKSSGHFGQMDVSLSEEAPIGPDGGRGSLEAYIGLPALVARFGQSPEHVSTGLSACGEPVRALARALRIAHAIYKPTHIRLLGGVGMMLTACGDRLRGLVDANLTCVAHPGWSLGFAISPHHAACGAARLAGGCVPSVQPHRPT